LAGVHTSSTTESRPLVPTARIPLVLLPSSTTGYTASFITLEHGMTTIRSLNRLEVFSPLAPGLRTFSNRVLTAVVHQSRVCTGHDVVGVKAFDCQVVHEVDASPPNRFGGPSVVLAAAQPRGHAFLPSGQYRQLNGRSASSMSLIPLSTPSPKPQMSPSARATIEPELPRKTWE
jgi:hypothetical protein